MASQGLARIFPRPRASPCGFIEPSLSVYCAGAKIYAPHRLQNEKNEKGAENPKKSAKLSLKSFAFQKNDFCRPRPLNQKSFF